MVSVCIVTFKQEGFILDALKGVLNQKVSFPVEVIVADDCSPDSTREVVAPYVGKYSEFVFVKYVKHAENKGMNENFLWTLNQTKGKYVSICEGDDYWLYPNRLNDQVEFLETNLDYIATTSDTSYLIGKDIQSDSYMKRKAIWLKREIPKLYTEFSFKDIASRFFPHTSTWMFRNGISMPEDYTKFPIGDLPLFLALSHSGRVGYMPRLTSVYRINDVGVTNELRLVKAEEHLKDIAFMYTTLDRFFLGARRVELVTGYKQIVESYLERGNGVSDLVLVIKCWCGFRLNLGSKCTFVEIVEISGIYFTKMLKRKLRWIITMLR